MSVNLCKIRIGDSVMKSAIRFAEIATSVVQ